VDPACLEAFLLNDFTISKDPKRKLDDFRKEILAKYPYQKGTSIFRGLENRQIESVLRKVIKQAQKQQNPMTPRLKNSVQSKLIEINLTGSERPQEVKKEIVQNIGTQETVSMISQVSVLNPESPSAKIFNAAEDHALKDFIDPYTPIDHLNTMILKIESLKTRIVRLTTIKPRRWHDAYRFKFREAIDSS
jgi:hypothetical protein